MTSRFVFKVQVLVSSASPVLQWPIPQHGGTLGRAQECTWVLDDPNRIVSRQQARIHLNDSSCFWTDLGTNSTHVNGKPMSQGEAIALNEGDVLKIGDYLLTLELADAHWSGLQALMPQQEVDPLESLMPQALPELNIDDLLADLNALPPELLPEPVASVPVLARRMYVGLQGEQGEQVQPKVDVQAVENEMANLKGLLFVSVKGYMQLLQARRVFKLEMGGDLTTISGKANNPLKFSSSPEEALNRLLGEASPAYLTADQALQQAFEDVLGHMQLSVERIQSVVEQVQTQLAPEVIMSEAARQGALTLGLSAARKARLWDLYCERYQKLSNTWN
jgi:type VI secretion system protein ImpI